MIIKAIHPPVVQHRTSLPDFGQLLEQIARKNEAAMTELYDATVGMARLYVRRFVCDMGNAEEVLQDVYWHIWIHAHVYNASRGTPRAWLFMIIRSRAIDSIRRNRYAASNVELSDGPLFASPIYADCALEKMWRAQLIGRTLARLPESEHKFIQLAFFDGCTHVEIARQTGVPLGTVKTKIRKALTSMRDALPPKMETAW